MSSFYKKVYLLNLKRKKKFIETTIKFYQEELIRVNKAILSIELGRC